MTIKKNIEPNLNPPSNRQYFLDWLRVIAFAYLVFYHTGMMFVEWSFHIESGHDSAFLKPIMMLTSNWRLDLLFLVSGVAIGFMTTKITVRAFLKQRFIKLFIPLLFAIIIVIAPQAYYEGLQKNIIEPGFWQFWTNQYFSFSWLPGMNAPFPTYNHMWYVFYLFFYTLFLIPIIVFMNSDKGVLILKTLESWITKGSRIFWAPYVFYLSVFFYMGHNDVTHNFFNDPFGHFIFMFILILGMAFIRMPKIWHAFEDNRFISLSFALIFYAILLGKYYAKGSFLPLLNWDLIEILIKWSWIATLIGFAKHYLNFTNQVLQYCNSLVYPFFILHQTIIIIIGYYIIDWGMNGVFEFIAIIIGTFAISIALIELIIKKTNILRILFGMKLI